jgi:predicted nucleic acid-binding protein
MTLVDTSVWIDHFRKDNPTLKDLLEHGKVAVHPFIIGELACGNLRNRSEILHLLGELPQATVAEHYEVMSFLEAHKLYGTGMGWIDAHLIASALLTNLNVLTYHKAIGDAAINLGIEFKEGNLG